MKTIRSLLLVLVALLLAAPTLFTAQAAQKIRVLVVTGGHDFERDPFFQMFKDNPDITFRAVEHPRAHPLFKEGPAQSFDVLVFYDMWQPIEDQAKQDLVALLKNGKGLVALHHCLGSYQDWPEYRHIIGGKYYLKETTVDGVNKPASTYKHDVNFHVKIADPNHPVTRGVKDFDILDETYGQFEVLPDMHALLSTEESTSSPTVGWLHEYAKARVVTLQLGHDHHAFENPNYRRLLAQSIRWVARKD